MQVMYSHDHRPSHPTSDSPAQVICELNPVLRGWLMYYEAAKCASFVCELEGWIRRKLGCIRLKQCKRVYILQQFLERQGVKKWQSWILAFFGKGWWRKSGTLKAPQAMGDSMVQGSWLIQFVIKPWSITLLDETVRCESMLGGVRGRGSNLPTYSMLWLLTSSDGAENFEVLIFLSLYLI